MQTKEAGPQHCFSTLRFAPLYPSERMTGVKALLQSHQGKKGAPVPVSNMFLGVAAAG